MKLSKPNKKTQEIIDLSKDAAHQATRATANVVSISSSLLCQLSNSLEKGSEAFASKINDFNVEQNAKAPFSKIKINAQEVKHIAELCGKIAPASYTYFHHTIIIIIDMMNITINLMDATIDHPEQRNRISLLFNKFESTFTSEFKNFIILRDKIMKEMYELGLTHNASTGDKIRFILDHVPDGEIEKFASEHFSNAKQSLQDLQIARTVLQEKGFGLVSRICGDNQVLAARQVYDIRRFVSTPTS